MHTRKVVHVHSVPLNRAMRVPGAGQGQRFPVGPLPLCLESLQALTMLHALKQGLEEIDRADNPQSPKDRRARRAPASKSDISMTEVRA